MNLVNRILIKTALVFTTLIVLSITIVSINAEQEKPNLIFGYRINASLPSGLTLNKIQSINTSLIIGLASNNDGNYVIVLNTENPYEEPIIVQLYPILGEITSISTNGWPVKRIAIGTSMGEVIIFNVLGGKVYKLVDKILGADFYVKKILIMKKTGVHDQYVYAVLVDENYIGETCSQCSVYIFDENQLGYSRIGLEPGDVSYSITNRLISDIAARAIYSEEEFYYDSSYLLLVSIEKPNLLRIDINVTQYDYLSEQYRPASGALIDVYAYGSGKSYKYSVNAGPNGIATIFVERGMVAEITAWDIVYRNYTVIINTSMIPSYVTYLSTSLSILYPPLTVPAETKTPPYLLASITVYDVSQAPSKLVEKGKILNTTNPVYPFDLTISFFNRGVNFVYVNKTREHVLTYYDIDSQSILIWRVKEKDGKLQAFKFNKDYVGKQAFLQDSFVTKDNNYLLTVLSDSRVRIYRVPIAMEDKYELLETYKVGSTLIDSQLMITDKYVLYAETPEGIQVLGINEKGISPLLRKDLVLNYRPKGTVDLEVSNDLNTLFILLEDNKFLIFKNIRPSLRENPLSLDDYITGALTLKLQLNPEDVPTLRIILKHPWGETVYRSLQENFVVIPNIIPNITYSLYIESDRPYIIPYSIALNFDNYTNYILTARIEYKSFTLNLRISDLISKVLIAPVDIYIDDELIIANTTSDLVSIKAYYGSHNLKIKSSNGYESVYETFETSIYVTNDTFIDIPLIRKTYVLHMRIIDGEEETLLGPLKLDVLDEKEPRFSSIIAPNNPVVLITLPYDIYTIRIYPIEESKRIYQEVEAKITLNEDKTTTLVIPRKVYSMNLMIRDITIGTLKGSFVAVVNNKTISTRFYSNTTIFLPYGKYTLRVVPTDDTIKIYNPSQNITLLLDGDTSFIINMTRKSYRLNVLVMEKNNPVMNAEVRFFSLEGNRLITILMTNEMGYTETNLPYGEYSIEVLAKGYNPTKITYTLESSSSLTIQVKPTITTLVIRALRFALPYVGAGLVTIASIYGIIRLREIIRKRMEREEAPF